MHPRADYDAAVIGGGIAGLSAAVQAGSRGAEVCLVEAEPMHGGLVFNVGALDDYPSPQALSGAALAEHLLARARAGGARSLEGRVRSIVSVGGGFAIETEAGARIGARSAIVATGARLRRLGVPGEAELEGRGVSRCDWCDAGFFRGQPVAVVGGGDAAMQAALHLAKTSSTVTVIVRGAEARARRSYLERAADESRIEFLWDTRVVEIVGADRVEALRLESDDPSAPARLECAGVFVFAGLEACTDAVTATAARDGAGRLQTGADLQTTVPGLFAAGAVRSGHPGGLAAAIGDGSVAAAGACAWARQDG